MLISIVAGSFNDDGGKKSGWADKFHKHLKSNIGNDSFIYQFVNGGNTSLLNELLTDLEKIKPNVIIWLADVPNDKPKLVKNIKESLPHSLLVTSKRNLEDTYSLQDIVSRALSIKSNLVLEFTGNRSDIKTSIYDPLGNCFINKSSDINEVSKSLINRLIVLNSVARVNSYSIGDKINAPITDEVNNFMSIIKEQAESFHSIIHGVITDRMLGNASFRCARGFPSFRNKELVFVSQRNIDKRYISPEVFVACSLHGGDNVNYFGDVKPSVDTPVQIKLYNYYKNINFMLHSHTYIEDAHMTKDVLPCGAIEEFDQIIREVPERNVNRFYINIRGHGSIVFSCTAELIKDTKWIARPTPEFI